MPIWCFSGPVTCPAGTYQGSLPENQDWAIAGYYFTAGNSYTLEICDSSGDGTLPYTITDMLSGTVYGTGNFTFSSAGQCHTVVIGPLEGSAVFSGPGVTNNNNGIGTFNPTGLTCGTYTVTYSFDNGNGCADSASQFITILDEQAPVFPSIPEDTLLHCSAEIPPMANLFWTDNCEGSGTVSGSELSDGGTCPEIITRTWVYTDACGNTTQVSQTITRENLCPDSLYVPGPIASGLYEADIHLYSNGSIDGSFITFHAGVNILLNAGFETLLGVEFTAEIAPCGIVQLRENIVNPNTCPSLSKEK